MSDFATWRCPCCGARIEATQVLDPEFIRLVRAHICRGAAR